MWDKCDGCLGTFSHDSTGLASMDRTVEIWDTSSGECIQMLDIGESLYNGSFDSLSSYLETGLGTFVILFSFTNLHRRTSLIREFKSYV